MMSFISQQFFQVDNNREYQYRKKDQYKQMHQSKNEPCQVDKTEAYWCDEKFIEGMMIGSKFLCMQC